MASVFPDARPEPWDKRFLPRSLHGDEVRAYCRHNLIPDERADTVELPLWLTKRGVLVPHDECMTSPLISADRDWSNRAVAPATPAISTRAVLALGRFLKSPLSEAYS